MEYYTGVIYQKKLTFKVKVKIKSPNHIFASKIGEFEKELKDRIETALYLELKDDYIKNEDIDLEFAVE